MRWGLPLSQWQAGTVLVLSSLELLERGCDLLHELREYYTNGFLQ